MVGFFSHIHQIHRLALHAEGKFVGRDPRFEIVRPGFFGGVLLVERTKQVQFLASFFSSKTRRRLEIEDRRPAGSQRGPLIGGRQIAALQTAAPFIGPPRGSCRTMYPGTFSIFRAQTVSRPAPPPKGCPGKPIPY